MDVKKRLRHIIIGHPICLGAFCVMTSVFLFGQRMLPFGVVGDERIYLLITKNLPQLISLGGLNDYRIQRILPLALVHYSIKLFHFPMTVKNIVAAFGVYNVLLGVCIAHIWVLICRTLKISTRGQWLGFIAIFLNYQMLKFIPFVVVSTDLYAYTITFALVYFYLNDRPGVIAVLTFFGAFTWPTIVYTGGLLLMFPKNTVEPKDEKSRVCVVYRYGLPAALVLFLTMKFKAMLPLFESGRIYQYGVFSMGSNRPLLSVIYLSIFIVLAYIWVALSQLLGGAMLGKRAYWFTTKNIPRIILGIAVILAAKEIVYVLAATHNARPLDYLLMNLLAVSIMQPGVFLISHVLYFGPIVFFVFFLWRPICRLLREYGAGLVLCMILVIIFSLDSESRKQMNTFPILLPFLIKVLDRFKIKRVHLIVLSIFSLALSKIWLIFPKGPWGSNPLVFPSQFYYMTMGAWMSHQMYFVQAAAVATMGCAFYFVLINRRSKYHLKEHLGG